MKFIVISLTVSGIFYNEADKSVMRRCLRIVADRADKEVDP